ncbi:MAG TPA: hypothetical protein VF647_03950 [Longimicrobium sp.]|jgi:hypothetical protein
MHTDSRDILGDGVLGLRVAPALEGAAGDWVYPLPPAGPNPVRALIELVEGRAPPRPSGTASVRGPGMEGWIEGARLVLIGDGGEVGGMVELDALRARVEVAAGAQDSFEGRLRVREALSISAALLLARQHRALLHGAAVVAPGGGAWVLVGDTHSGKTTTCANLVRAGHGYLADDQVVVHADGAGTLVATGLPRRFTLDDGFARGESLGVRSPVDPDELFGPGSRRASAPLAGVLFPRVEAHEPTRTERTTAADALTRLLRNSPWLAADPVSARPLLALLARIARLPAHDVRLGRDTLDKPAHLAALLASAAAQNRT